MYMFFFFPRKLFTSILFLQIKIIQDTVESLPFGTKTAGCNLKRENVIHTNIHSFAFLQATR